MTLLNAMGSAPNWAGLLNGNRGRVSLFEMLLGQGQPANAESMAPVAPIRPAIAPPAPMPATGAGAVAPTMAPSPQPVATSQVSGEPSTPRGLGDVLGFGGSPIYEFVRKSGLLEDLGYGLATGTSFGDALGIATRRSAEMSGQRNQEQATLAARRSTAERLRAMGPDYATLAEAVETGVIDPGEATRTAWSTQLNARQQSQELERARANAQFLSDPELRAMVEGGALSFEDAYKMQQGGVGSPVNYGTSLQYGRDAAGNLVPLQAGDNGTLIRSQLPEGVVAIDPGAAAGARAGATYDAKTVSAAKAALPSVEQNLGIALDAIDRLRDDKAGLEANFSQWGALPRGMYVQGGTPLANWMTNLNQASGQAFMQARQALKGGGQITDYEGRRAEAAISRISDAAKSGDVQTFLAALDEFEAAVTEGYAKLREVAGGGYQPGAGSGTGDIFDRYGLER